VQEWGRLQVWEGGWEWQALAWEWQALAWGEEWEWQALALASQVLAPQEQDGSSLHPSAILPRLLCSKCK
jgi:hypothetical protein